MASPEDIINLAFKTAEDRVNVEVNRTFAQEESSIAHLGIKITCQLGNFDVEYSMYNQHDHGQSSGRGSNGGSCRGSLRFCKSVVESQLALLTQTPDKA